MFAMVISFQRLNKHIKLKWMKPKNVLKEMNQSDVNES